MKRSSAPRSERSGAPRQPMPRGFWVLWTTVVIDMIGFGIVIPVQAFYAEKFGASAGVIGLIGGTFSLAQFVCAPLWGRLSDRIGRKPVLLISLAGTVAGFIVTASASSLWMLFLGRLIDGASGATIGVAQAAVSDLASPRERPKLMGMLGAAFGIGFVLGPAIGALASHSGLRVPFIVAAAMAAANLVATFVRFRETHHVAGAMRSNGLLAATRVWDLPNFRRVALVVFVSVASFSAFESTFALFGQRRMHIGPGGVGLALVGVGAGMVIIQGGLIGKLSARFSVLGMLRFGTLVTAGGLLAFGFTTGYPLYVIALLLIVVGQGVGSPTLSSTTAAVAPADRRGEVLGATQSVSSIARIVGPTTGGWLFGHLGVGSPYVAGAAGCVVAALVVGRIKITEAVEVSH